MVGVRGGWSEGWLECLGWLGVLRGGWSEDGWRWSEGWLE